MALKQAKPWLQKLFHDYYAQNPREFITLLEIIQKNSIHEVQVAVEKLKMKKLPVDNSYIYNELRDVSVPTSSYDGCYDEIHQTVACHQYILWFRRCQLMELIRDLSTQLRLPYLKENALLHLEQARIENKSYEDFLTEILEYEVELKNQNSVKNRMKRAQFPYHKTLDELVVDELPDGAKIQYHQLRSLDFIKHHQNVILAGNPGTGKTHISIGLGVKACMAGNGINLRKLERIFV